MKKTIFTLIMGASIALAVFTPPGSSVSVAIDAPVDKVEFTNGWAIEVSGTNLVYTYTAP